MRENRQNGKKTKKPKITFLSEEVIERNQEKRKCKIIPNLINIWNVIEYDKGKENIKIVS